jgi:hypothetical protein
MCRTYLISVQLPLEFDTGRILNREPSWGGLPALYATDVRSPYVQVGEHALCSHLGGHDSYSLCQSFFFSLLLFFRSLVSHAFCLFTPKLTRRIYMRLTDTLRLRRCDPGTKHGLAQDTRVGRGETRV